MSSASLEKLEERLNRKKRQMKELNSEISVLEGKIKAMRQASIAKAVNDSRLTTEQCKALAEGLNNGTLFDYLKRREEQK